MLDDWNEINSTIPGCHYLQTSQWAEVKLEVGWKSEHLTWKDDEGKIIAAAQMLIHSKRLSPIGPTIKLGYIPRGPLMDWENPTLRIRILDDLKSIASDRGLAFLKVDPYVLLGKGTTASQQDFSEYPGESVIAELFQRGWCYSPEQVQFKNTVILLLEGSEENWLARMKQKTRYNLRLAQKSGVIIDKAQGTDLPALYRMYAETASRDGFIIRPENYYLSVWDKFMKAGMAEGLIASVDGQLVAGLFIFFLGKTAWYVYGMSTSKHREKMPNYLLQWEAMRLAKGKGCMVYDLWGAPEKFDPSDEMFGVYRFKEGLGGEVDRTIGAWDLPIKPLLYKMIILVLPRLLSITRRIRRKQISQELQ